MFNKWCIGLFLTMFFVIATGENIQDDDVLAAWAAMDREPDLYQTGKGTPAQFYTDRFYLYWLERMTFRDRTTPETYAWAKRRLADFARQVKLGLAWKTKPCQIELPLLAESPVLDGSISDEAWRNARTFRGEYQLNREDKSTNSENTVWRVGIRPEGIYFGAEFSDRDLRGADGIGFAEPDPLYQGDGFELFFRPDVHSPYFYEVLLNPAGKCWIIRHKATPAGQWEPVNTRWSGDVQTRTASNGHGFSVEVLISRHLLKAGASASFMMLHNNRDTGMKKAITSSCVPLLYSGHNLQGHIQIVPMRIDFPLTALLVSRRISMSRFSQP